MNLSVQEYKGVQIRLIPRKDYLYKQAKRYILGNSSQNIWIPNSYLDEDGTIKSGSNIDFIFRKAYNQRKLEYAKIQVNPYLW